MDEELGGGGWFAVGIGEIGFDLGELCDLFALADSAVGFHPAHVGGDVAGRDGAVHFEFDFGVEWFDETFVLEIVHGLFEELAVHFVAYCGDVAGLFSAEEVACSSDFEIAHGDFEACSEHGVFFDGFESFDGDGGE